MRQAWKRVDRKMVFTQSGSLSRSTVRTSSGAMRKP
ncbi:Uncharacterised protein [Mycobacteroides abscessus subsp. abscessus]|nr:Uncharacterised protein [Mycobacteroides abscessus subsp. abscessus]